MKKDSVLQEVMYPIYQNKSFKNFQKDELSSMAYRKRNKTVTQTEEKKDSVKYVKPLTKGQEEYVRAMVENEIVLCAGPSGSGKTHLAVALACQHLSEGKIKKVLLSRPIVTASVKNLGALPGDIREKIDPYLIPVVEEMNKYFTRTITERYIREGVIELAPLELLRGRTFDDCFMIVDESQNCTFEQIQMFITRIGKNSKVVVNGDFEQTDLKSDTGGFEDCVELLDGIKGIAVIELGDKDIVRAEIIKRVLHALRGREDLYRIDK